MRDPREALADLASLGDVTLDGTQVKANASRYKAMSHGRMLKTEAQLEAESAALLRKARAEPALVS